MERLQELLKACISKIPSSVVAHNSWIDIYAGSKFPAYWELVYKIAEKLSKEYRVLEIGSGIGYVTAIFNYLGFKQIVSFESNQNLLQCAQELNTSMIANSDITFKAEYTGQQIMADIVVLVNCVYVDKHESKKDYLTFLQSLYENAGHPKHLLIEVIDESYKETDSQFPNFVRLSESDLRSIYPVKQLRRWETYVFPYNKKSKTLYHIETA